MKTNKYIILTIAIMCTQLVVGQESGKIALKDLSELHPKFIASYSSKKY